MSSSDDEITLQLNIAVGSSVYHNVARLTGETLFYGFFAALFAYSITISLKRTSKIMFGIILFSFVLGTIHWASTVAFTLTQISALLRKDQELDVATRIDDLPPKVFAKDLISFWTGLLAPILSDATILWRCQGIYPETRYILLVPLAALLGTIGLSLHLLISLSDITTWTDWATNGGIPLLSNVQLAIFILSFCTNFITTMIIGVRLWQHRRFIKQLVGRQRMYQSAQNVVAILLESGLAYSAFQLALVGIAAAPAPKYGSTYITGMIYLAVYCQLSAMYPTVVVILVQLNMSMMENGASLATMTNATGTTIEFSDDISQGRHPMAQESKPNPNGMTTTQGTTQSGGADSKSQLKNDATV